MSNTLLTTTAISNSFLAEFVTQNSYINMADRGLTADFNNKAGYKIGNTIQVRKRNRAEVGDGRVAVPTPIVDATDTLTVNHQYHTMVEITSVEKTLDLQNFQEQVAKPTMTEIMAKMNRDIWTQALTDLNYTTGTAGSNLNTFAGVRSVQSYMNKLNMPISQRNFIVSEDAGADLESALYNTFNQNFNKDLIMDGYMGRLAGYDFMTDQAVNVYVPGTAAAQAPGAITVTGNVSSGSTIVIACAANGTTFKAGDVITIAGVNAVSPLGRVELINTPMSFTITADATVAGGAATLTVNPAIITTGPRKNVSAQIDNGAVVTMVIPTAGSAVNLAFGDSALDLVCPPLEILDVKECAVSTNPKYNVSVRVSSQGDITNDANLWRVDVLCGFKWHNEYAVKVLSAR